MGSSKKVLICTPTSEIGGVANYYTCIRPFLNENYNYLKIGLNDPTTFSIVSLLKSMKDFYLTLKHSNYGLVILNPSLDIKSLIRDSILSIIAKFFNVQLIIFFRGYNQGTENFLNLFPFFLYPILLKSDSVITLSSTRREFLRKLGYKKPIFNETTTFSFNVNKEYKYEEISTKPPCNEINLLFLSRLLKEKGIFETIKAFDLLCKKYNHINLLICGDGIEKDNVLKVISDRKKIKYFGYVTGGEKEKIFDKSHIFIYPTYEDGMPNVVLEAMAYGLPVITRQVGGLKDFFINGKHGFITESKSPQIFASLIHKLINDDKLVNNIRLNNIFLAKNRFAPDVVADRINGIVNDTLIKC